MKNILCKLDYKEKLTQDVFSFIISSPEIAQIAKPGQFAEIKVKGHTLRRPISICEIGEGILRFVFQVRGDGTENLSRIKVGEMMDIIAPLGNGFPLLENSRKALIIGGGIGVPPLLELSKHYGENAEVNLGFRSKNHVILQNDFSALGSSVRIATDDGSYGFHGFVTDMVSTKQIDIIYACGPYLMLKNVVALAEKKGISCFISLEEHMACGIGACLGCAVRLKDNDGVEYYGHVCKNGPVFDYRSVVM